MAEEGNGNLIQRLYQLGALIALAIGAAWMISQIQGDTIRLTAEITGQRSSLTEVKEDLADHEARLRALERHERNHN